MRPALVLDFDGLILDTEEPELVAWQEIFAAHGASLTVQDWIVCVGTHGALDPLELLRERATKPVDAGAVHRSRLDRVAAALDGARPLPGVAELIAEAAELGVPLGVASSSPRAWVVGHLSRLGLLDAFGCVACRDDDDVRVAKPDPASYRAALRSLGAAASRSVAIEDSAHGIAAAKAAGMVCVAVPNAVTGSAPLPGADVVLPSLLGVRVADLPWPG